MVIWIIDVITFIERFDMINRDKNFNKRGFTLKELRRPVGVLQRPILKDVVLNDPWENPYVYEYERRSKGEPQLMSFGADGKMGGEGADTDLYCPKKIDF